MKFLVWHFVAFKNLVNFIISRPDKIKIITNDERKKVAVFSFSKQNYRFYYPIIRHLSTAGYHCYIEVKYKFFNNSGKFLEWILKLENVYFTFSITHSKNVLLYFRDEKSFSMSYQGSKTIYLSDDVYQADGRHRKGNIIPFSMHPDQYTSCLDRQLLELRETKRQIKIFFSGNISGTGYIDEVLNKLHGKMSRRQLIFFIKQRFGEKIANNPNEHSVTKPIHLYTSEFWLQDQVKEHFIHKTTWLRQLAKSHFFLACPGFSHPICHNIIEAMAVGCIPILEHGDYFSPPLVNNINCISFEGTLDLDSAIEYVLTLKDERINKMRENVIFYYDQYLSSRAIVEKFEKADNEDEFYFYSSAQSLRVYKEL